MTPQGLPNEPQDPQNERQNRSQDHDPIPAGAIFQKNEAQSVKSEPPTSTNYPPGLQNQPVSVSGCVLKLLPGLPNHPVSVSEPGPTGQALPNRFASKPLRL